MVAEEFVGVTVGDAEGIDGLLVGDVMLRDDGMPDGDVMLRDDGMPDGDVVPFDGGTGC